MPITPELDDEIQSLWSNLLRLNGERKKMRAALESAAACFDTLDPREPSGLSDAETASLFNATREAVRLALT